MKASIALGLTAVAALAVVSASLAQPAPPPSPPPSTPAAPVAPRPIVYPARPVDPAGVERGRLLFAQNGCAACHGADTRGGTGPALQRRALVLRDVRGELIGPFLEKGLPNVPNHVFKFELPQVVDIADFLHSQRTLGTGSAGIIQQVPSILTGSAGPGEAYFKTACAACHSATGDLAGVATRYADAKTLQQRWLAPRATQPVTAVVALPSGPVSGDVTALDEFELRLKTPQGEQVIARDGDKPKVTLKNPLSGHKALLRQITDTQIHDVTAYLVTLK
jgi:cytochrome c oxidase cbb3-type subunit 3